MVNKNNSRQVIPKSYYLKNVNREEDEEYDSSHVAKSNMLQFSCLVLACIICYYNSTHCGLVFDDISAIRDNKDLRPTSPWKNIFLNDFWGTRMYKEQSHKSYRPLTVLTFRLNYWLHEVEPFGYHFVNVILHLVVVFMFRRACRLLFRHCCNTIEPTRSWLNDNTCSFLAALLFAVHPIHTEAVTGVVGRAELLSSIFFLGAFLIYAKATTKSPYDDDDDDDEDETSSPSRPNNNRIKRKTTQWWHLAFGFNCCLVASVLCKEQGITIAGICVVYEILVVQQISPKDIWHCIQYLFEDQARRNTPSPGRKKRAAIILKSRLKFNMILYQRLAFLASSTLAVLISRLYIMGSQLPVFTRFDNPASVAATPSRQLTYSYLAYVNMKLLLYPFNLCCDWTMGTIPVIKGLSDIRNFETLFALIALVFVIVRAVSTRDACQMRIILLGLTLLILPFLPASNLFFPVGFVIAERILYMPSMGFCILVAYGYAKLNRRFSSAERIMNKVLKLMVGILLISHGCKTVVRNWDWQTEYSLFMSGLQVNTRNAKLFNNVGHALEGEKRFDEALVYFKRAVAIQPDDIGAHMNVGRTYNSLQKYKEAEAAYRKAKSLFPQVRSGETYQARIAPNHLNVFLNLASLIAKNESRLEEADFLYRQAISMRSDYVQAYINRGDVLMRLNKTLEAQEVYEKALLYDSENPDIYYNLGVVFLEQGKTMQAHVYFNKALEIRPDHEQALMNSAILLQELGEVEARKIANARLVKALDRDENNEKIYFNLGMMAMDENRLEDAENFLKRAIHIKGDLRSALFNLALMLADNNRPMDAVAYLNQLVKYHPEHSKGLLLLGDIHVNHIKDMEGAEKCYRSILTFDPQNIQALHNLCVVFVGRHHYERARECFRYARYLEPNEEYIKDHLIVVNRRLKYIATLPKNAIERKLAKQNYDPLEFRVIAANGADSDFKYYEPADEEDKDFDEFLAQEILKQNRKVKVRQENKDKIKIIKHKAQFETGKNFEAELQRKKMFNKIDESTKMNRKAQPNNS